MRTRDGSQLAVSPTRAPKTILMVDPWGERGGGQALLVNIVAGLDRSLFKPVVVLLAPGPLAADLRRAGAIVYVFPRHRRRQVLMAARVAAGIAYVGRKERAAVIHINGVTVFPYCIPLRFDNWRASVLAHSRPTHQQ